MNIVSLSRKLILSIALISGGMAITAQASAPKGTKNITQHIASAKLYIREIKARLANGRISQEQLSAILASEDAEDLQGWLDLDGKSLDESFRSLKYEDAQSMKDGVEAVYSRVMELEADEKYDAEDSASTAATLAHSAAGSILSQSAASHTSLNSYTPIAKKTQPTAAQLSAMALSDADYQKFLKHEAQKHNGANKPQASTHKGNCHPHKAMHPCMKAMLARGCHGRRHGHHFGQHGKRSHSAAPHAAAHAHTAAAVNGQIAQQPTDHAPHAHGHGHHRGGHGFGHHRGGHRHHHHGGHHGCRAKWALLLKK